MSGLFGTVSWAPGAAAAHDLEQLLAQRVAAPWQRVERASEGGCSLAAVWPASREGGLRPVALAHGGGVLAALAAGGDASTGAETLRAAAPGTRGTGRATTHPPTPFDHAGIRYAAGTLHLLSDLLGTHPLYVRRRSYGVAVATSALVLARLEPIADLEPLAVVELLTYGQLVGKRTLFTGVEALPPGTVRRYRPAGPPIEPGGDPTPAAATAPATVELESTETIAAWPSSPGSTGGSLRERARALLAELEQTVAAATHPGTAGLLLSGGVDSRLLAALLVRSGQSLATYTFGEPGCADLRLAARVAGNLCVPHRRAPSTAPALAALLPHAVALTDGSVSAVHFHGLDLLPVVRQSCAAEWNGFAGDAILGGTFAHPRYWRPGPPAVERRLFGALAVGLPPAALGQVLAAGPARDLRSHAEQALAPAIAAVRGEPRERAALRVLMTARVARLAAVGLALDRHYLPVVTPYAHHAALLCMLRMAPGERRFSRLLRAALVAADPELARIPWQRTGAPPRAPWPWQLVVRSTHRLRNRLGWGRSAALIDYQRWFTGPLAATRTRYLESLARHPLFAGDALRARAGGGEPAGGGGPAARRRAADVTLDGVLISLGAALELLERPGPLPAGPL